MALERLRQSVLEEAKAEAERLLAAARATRDARLKAASERAEAERLTRVAQERRRLDQEREQALANAARRERVEMLAEKNQLITRALEAAREQLHALPAPDYLALIAKWLLALDPDVSGEVNTNERDADRVTPEFLERVNRERPASGQLRRGRSDLPIGGGVIVSADRYQVDLSLEAMLGALRETLTPRLAAILFSEEADG